MRKRLNDKGSALVTVIVACAVIGMLAVVSLWISLTNYQMKITDSKVKDNFYSAEYVLDQICTGLQGDVSKAYTVAYTRVMQKYSILDEEGRNNSFTREYVNTLCDELKSSTAGDRNYSMDILESYVEASLLDTNSYPYAKITSTSASGNSNDGLMSTYDTGVVLKGIKVEYVDDEGFSSIITTDISLGIPEMKFITSEDMPDIFSYSTIANSGVELNGEKSNVSFKGSIYSGSPFAVNVANRDDMSFNLKDIGIKLTLSESKYLIAEGTINISNTSEFSIASDNQIWTDNIEVGGGANVHLRGSTYVADDLTLNGNQPNVYLGAEGSGRYIGYGNKTDNASDSSAIIINGKNSTLDMSGLDDLFVGGYSFIQTSSIMNNNGIANNDVRMGESIALKGDQIGYLLPGECIGVENGKSLYNRNPITYVEYDKIVNDDKYTEVDENVVSTKTGHALKDYMDDNESVADCVSTVFVPTGSGQANDGLVYFYISLSSDSAARYYTDYYAENKDKLNTYADFFANVIKCNDSASRVYTAGKYSLYESDELSLLGTEIMDVDDEITMLQHTYTALNSTLSPAYDRGNSIAYGKTVFENLIDIDVFNILTSGQSGGKLKVNYSAGAGEVMTAVVVDGDYTYNGENSEGGKLRLIIASGDVTLNSDFKGTIICLGKVKVNGNCNISNEDVEQMKKMLTANINEQYSLYNVFIDGRAYIVSVSGGSGAASSGDTDIAYSDIIKYKNWTKE